MGRRVLPVAAMAAIGLALCTAATARVGQEQSEKIIFISTRGGEPDLFALDSGNGRMARLTESSGTGDDVVVSRDGSRIAFSRHDGIEVVGTDGRGRRRVPECDLSPVSFSPDGGRLACKGLDDDVVLVDLGSSAVQRLAPTTSSVPFPEWSPDGRFVAFNDEGGRMAVDVRGGAPRLVSPRRTLYATWSPDSSRIAFESNNGLYLVNADGSGERRLLRAELRDLAWSPDGRAIAVIVGECCGPGTLALVDSSSGGLRRIARRAASPSWSPSGSWIAFDRPRGTGYIDDSDLYAIKRDGTGFRALTQPFPDGGWNRRPLWVPGPVVEGLRRANAPVTRLRPQRELALRLTFNEASEFAVDGWRAAAKCTVWDVRARRPLQPRACREGADAVALSGSRLTWLHLWCSCNLEGYADLRFADPPYRREQQAVFSATQNESGNGEEAANVVGDRRLLAFNLNRYRGEGSLRARQLWTIPRRTRWPRLCPESSSGLDNGTGSGRFCVRIRTGDDAVPLDVDRGRILALRDDGPLLLIRADGRRLRRWALKRGEVKGAAVSGSTLVVSTDTQLRVYDVASGALRKSWQLPIAFAPARIEDASGNLAVYVRGGAVHLIRLQDGRDTALYSPGQSAFVHARLEQPGLYYAYNKSAAKPGRIAFVPRARLGRLAANGRSLPRSPRNSSATAPRAQSR